MQIYKDDIKKSLTPTGLVLHTNMASISLFLRHQYDYYDRENSAWKYVSNLQISIFQLEILYLSCTPNLILWLLIFFVNGSHVVLAWELFEQESVNSFVAINILKCFSHRLLRKWIQSFHL